MLDIRVQGYENQVKLFLVLLVLFLVAAGLVGLNALYQTQALLLQEAESRITASTRAVQRELDGANPAAADPSGSLPLVERLRELARAFSISSIEILDMEGRVLAGTEPWRIGVQDTVAARAIGSGLGRLASGGAVIQEPVREAGDAEYGRDRGEVLVLLALKRDGGGSTRILKAGHEVLGVRTVTRQIRSMAWIQAVAGFVVLGLVLLFVRWVLRPYRALKAAAAQIGAGGSRIAPRQVDDPDELISSFRGVNDKLKEQESELERMRALAGATEEGIVNQELLDGLTSGVLIVGPRGNVAALNPAGEAILGLTRERVLGRDFRDVFSTSPRLLRILEDGVEAGRAHSREVVPYESRPGPPAHLGVTVSSIPSRKAPAAGAFCLFSDLTEIRGLQERVRLKENLAALGELSAGIAHEFRNSLATILGYARLIGREVGAPSSDSVGPASCGEHAAAIAREVDSIGRVVGEFLQYARPAALQTSEWDPRSVISEVAEEVSRDAGPTGVTISIEGSWPPSINADEMLLRQAFQNLLRNAVEAIPGFEGRVTVTGSLEEDGDQLRIAVADSGPGIDPVVLDRLFAPFMTTKDGGTGLGLSLVQKAVVSHDGTITAHNLETGGACFTVSLPRRT